MAELIAQGHGMCAGCGEAMALNQLAKAAPGNVVVSCATGCTEVTTSVYPLTAWKVPWIHAAFECAPAVASGIAAAAKRLGKNMKVVSLAGDGGTVDIGLQSLSGMLERGDKVTHVCLENGGYSNTGCQRSGATPLGAWTTTTPVGKKFSGKQQQSKNIMEIVAAHRIPYAATASVAYPEDMQAKFKKAIENQPSFLVIQCPCPPSWKIDTSMSVKAARLAVQTGMWALYEVEKGRLKMTMKPAKRTPVSEYLGMQGRFRHLAPEQVTEMQKLTDAEFARLEKIERSGILF
jgi:pyruvate ferredoxin oxidoreductase beta subunit